MTHLLSHEFKTTPISQREEDGYIDATSLCKASGKQFNDYSRLDTTKDFLKALESDTGIPVSLLVITKKGNSKQFEQGTWVHPKVAIHLGQWLSPEFAVFVTNLVFEWMNGKNNPTAYLKKPPFKQLGGYGYIYHTLDLGKGNTGTIAQWHDMAGSKQNGWVSFTDLAYYLGLDVGDFIHREKYGLSYYETCWKCHIHKYNPAWKVWKWENCGQNMMRSMAHTQELFMHPGLFEYIVKELKPEWSYAVKKWFEAYQHFYVEHKTFALAPPQKRLSQ
jgi:hypothetical protein